MSAQPAVNRPDFEQAESFVGSLQDDPGRYEVRYLFSPFLDIRDRIQWTISGFEWVRQGVFREARNFTYGVPNARDIEKGFNKRTMENLTLGRAPFARSAADIAEGWMRSNADIGGGVSGGGAPTGLVVLHHLQACDLHRPDHRAFLDTLNEMVWPVNYETADEHKALLQSLDLERLHQFPNDLIGGESLMRRAEKTVAQLLDDAIPKAESYCRRLYQELANEFKGLVAGGETAKGARREAEPEVQRACRWLAVPTPIKPSNALDAIYSPGGVSGHGAVTDAALSMIAQRVQQQGQVLELLAGKLVNNEPGTMEMFASFGDIMRSQQALLERLADREPVVVASAPAVAEENEEVSPKQGGKASTSKQKNNK